MTRIYIKIFFSFWLVYVLAFFGTDGVVYWFNLRPGLGLSEYRDNPNDRYAVRSLNDTIRFAILFDSDDIRRIVSRAEDWVFERIYLVDENGKDLRGRPIIPEVQQVLNSLSIESPFHLLNETDQTYAGRYIVLRDGGILRVVSFSTPAYSRRNFWLFYIQNNRQYFIISILILGVACFFLAMYLSKGIRTLQGAIREVGKGDLSVRVAPRFSNRRDEIGQLALDFDNMTTRLEQSMNEQKRLIKDVSHELRSPLARLQFALGIAQQRSNGSVDAELEKIREAADYLNNIISTILAFPTTEAETWELNDTVDLKVLLETLAEDYQEEAKSKSVTIQLQCDVDEALVATYGNTLTGVFENVINNALHYTLPNTTISILVQVENDSYVVSIHDQGPGVNEAELANIFEPFYRTDEARDRASGGYGLGLSIAQRTVALHRGSIVARNDVDGGLVVRITLPCGHYE